MFVVRHPYRQQINEVISSWCGHECLGMPKFMSNNESVSSQE